MTKSKLKDALEIVSMSQIPENALLDGVVTELVGREEFKDTDDFLNEKIFRADVFDEILGEQSELKEGTPMRLSKKVLDQIIEISTLVSEVQYVQVVEVFTKP